MQTFDTQKVMENVVGNIVTKVFYSLSKTDVQYFPQIKSKSAHRNNKSSKTAKSSSSLVNLADSSKLK